jgi:hypothetical protein
MKSTLLVCLIVFLSIFCLGQGSVSTGAPVVVNGLGQPLSGASVAICTSNPGTTAPPCSSLALTYTDITLGHACTGTAGTQPLNNQLNATVGTGCSNPGLTDGLGNAAAFSSAGTYWCQYYGPTITTSVVPCIFPASGTGTAAGNTGQKQVKNQAGSFGAEADYAVDQLTGATFDAKVATCVANLGGLAGTCDATGFTSTQTISATVIVPANTTLKLAPVVHTCNVAGAPCIKLTGQGAKVIGTNIGSTISSTSPSTATGSIIRMGTINSSTDGIAIQTTAASGSFTGYEVGFVTVDFNNAASNTGRHCLVGYSFSHSEIHNLQCYNAGVNGLEFETTAGGWGYDNHLRDITVFAAGNTAFNWTTVPGSGASDFDRWYCDRCKAVPTSSDGSFHSVNSFALNTGTGTQQTIADFFFTNLQTYGVAVGGNAGFYLNQTGTGNPPYIENIYVHGEIEQQTGCGCGTAVKVSNAGAANSVGYISLDIINQDTGFWFAQNNFTPTNIVGWRIHFQQQGIIFPPTTVPVATTAFPYQGLVWNSSTGNYEWILTPDGIVHLMRTDVGPIDWLDFDQSNERLLAKDNVSYIGTPGNIFKSMSAYQFISPTSVAFASLPAAAAGAQQYCSDCQPTANTCTAASAANCVCKGAGSGMWAKAENFMGNGLNWYCH